MSEQRPSVVRVGAVDIAVVRAPLAHPDLALTPIAAEPRVVMVGTAHELDGEQSLDVEDILHFPTLPLDAPTEWSDTGNSMTFVELRSSTSESRPHGRYPRRSLRWRATTGS